jgi:hypothetical protein
MKDEVFVKDFEEPVKNKGQFAEQEKKHKGKGFENADETHKQISVQREEEDKKKPAETVHVSTPLRILPPFEGKKVTFFGSYARCYLRGRIQNSGIR